MSEQTISIRDSMKRFVGFLDSNVEVISLCVFVIVLASVPLVMLITRSPDAKLERALSNYSFAIAGGDHVGACRQAGILVESYESARNLEEYKRWVAARDVECAKASTTK